MKVLLIMGLVLTITGCSTYKIKGDVNSDFAKQAIPKTQFFPSKEQLAGSTTSVLVMPAEITSSLAKKAELDKMVASDIENHLQKSKVKLIDRNKAKLLAKELKLAEVKGKSTYKGEQISDFVVMPHITDATFSRNFHEAYTSYGDDGKSYYHPARCVFKAKSAGFIEIYEMPALQPVERIAIKGSASNSTDARSSACSYSKNDTNALIVKASKDAVRRKKSDIKNIFAPKGYVIELRMNEDEMAIVKTTLGSKQGAATKAKVIIKQKRTESNALTGAQDITHVTVGEGLISDKVHGPYSWIVLDSKKSKLGDIRIGDTVILEYKDSTRDIFINAASTFSNLTNQ